MDALDREALDLTLQLIARLPVEAMEWLARRHFTPSALRRRRLAERDEAIRSLAIGRSAQGRELARDIHRDLRRYAAAAYRFQSEPPADKPARAAMYRALSLSRGGGALSETAIRRVLAGLSAGSKKPPAMSQKARYPAPGKEPRGRDEGAAEGGHRAEGRRRRRPGG